MPSTWSLSVAPRNRVNAWLLLLVLTEQHLVHIPSLVPYHVAVWATVDDGYDATSVEVSSRRNRSVTR
jgi:hypothetical protein